MFRAVVTQTMVPDQQHQKDQKPVKNAASQIPSPDAVNQEPRGGAGGGELSTFFFLTNPVLAHSSLTTHLGVRDGLRPLGVFGTRWRAHVKLQEVVSWHASGTQAATVPSGRPNLGPNPSVTTPSLCDVG